MRKTTKRLVSSVLVIFLLLLAAVTGVSAETYIIDDNFEFLRESDGTISIHKYLGNEENVTIPSTLVQRSVSKILDYAFMNETNLKSMTMPNSIVTIERGIFYGCSNLESVKLPKNCRNLGQYTFYDCSSLTSVELPTVLTEVPRFCFSRCTSLTSVSLPTTTKVINDYAFSNCTGLESVYVSRYTNSISETAFDNCPNLVIYGYMNTYAYDYALEHSIPFSPLDGTAQTFYVTFYNYDGSVFMSIPVNKGATIRFPGINPVKPATSTHYYEFSYWEGNIVNIQQNEFVYPVFEERKIESDVKNTYSVVFLDGDDVFLEVQSVEEGAAATTPSQVPTKKATEQYTYTFMGWDTDFTSVNNNLIVRPVFEEHLRAYNVTFKGFDGAAINEQTVAYGLGAIAPEAPAVEGYNFTGWDKDFDYITGDTVVTALYDKIKAPVISTTGTLKVEVTGGSGFSISVDSSAARPQGNSYVNSRMPVGAKVTLVANDTSQAQFLGWVIPANSVVVSTERTYTFVTSGNNHFKAMYSSDVSGVSMVSFVNSKSGSNGQYLDIQYYSSVDEISFPEAPSQTGFDFDGWNMTQEEIRAEIALGRDVRVEAKWQAQKKYVTVQVIGGSGSGEYLANRAVYAVADSAKDGEKFAYWVNSEGEIVSYNYTYKFFPNESMTITAVYVSEDTETEEQVIVSLDTIDTESVADKNIFYYSWHVPSRYTFVSAGILAVNKDNYNPATMFAGTTDSNVYDRSPSGENLKASNTYTWTKSNVYEGQVWIAKAYVQYRNESGQLITVYSAEKEAVKG